MPPCWLYGHAVPGFPVEGFGEAFKTDTVVVLENIGKLELFLRAVLLTDLGSLLKELSRVTVSLVEFPKKRGISEILFFLFWVCSLFTSKGTMILGFS